MSPTIPPSPPHFLPPFFKPFVTHPPKINELDTAVTAMCMIKISGGAGVVTPSEPPPPTNNFCLYPPPVLRCFWKDPLMTPTTPLEASFTVAPSPSTTPSPHKNFNHTPPLSSDPDSPKIWNMHVVVIGFIETRIYSPSLCRLVSPVSFPKQSQQAAR